MEPIPDDVIKYVIMPYLLPKDYISMTISSKYNYNQINKDELNFQSHYIQIHDEIQNRASCYAYHNIHNFKCLCNKTSNSAFCTRHHDIWLPKESTDVWWEPLQIV